MVNSKNGKEAKSKNTDDEEVKAAKKKAADMSMAGQKATN